MALAEDLGAFYPAGRPLIVRNIGGKYRVKDGRQDDR